ncbi:Holliday junction branch migration protein RuvA [Corynebacterium pacaense]|uniref:Holliday junction branch migration protein RuvA n=1 Tax=Corynebacterium pacaense TaxID=1816684 RepID=UPI0009BBB8DF|nr:Holliday junction branch migration protein RuvA [Corynebacterium pacaense]
MIASLRGTVIAIGLASAVIECSGVGYEVTAAPTTLARLSRGEETLILTTMVVREDATRLYGFLDNESREVFALLQTVSGLGPRLALACQSVFSPVEIARAITSADTRSLQRIPGVGKRMAERLVVELKDKMLAFDAGTANPVAEDGAQLPVANGAVVEQVTQALIGLGFPERQSGDAVAAVLSATPGLDTSAALRASLARLGGK